MGGTAPFGVSSTLGQPLALYHGATFGSQPPLRLLGCCRAQELDFGFIIKIEYIFGKSWMQMEFRYIRTVWEDGPWRPVIQCHACETPSASHFSCAGPKTFWSCAGFICSQGLPLQAPRWQCFVRGSACALWLVLMGLRKVSVGFMCYHFYLFSCEEGKMFSTMEITRKTWLCRCLCLSFLLYQDTEMRYFLSTYHDLGRRLPCVLLHISGIAFVCLISSSK